MYYIVHGPFRVHYLREIGKMLTVYQPFCNKIINIIIACSFEHYRRLYLY